jgi:hypothetical protein
LLPPGLCCQGRPYHSPPPPLPSCAPGSDIMLHFIYVCNQCVIHSSHLYPSLLGNFTGSRWGVNYGEKKGWPIIHVTMETKSRRSGVLYTGITWLLCTVQHKKMLFKMGSVLFLLLCKITFKMDSVLFVTPYYLGTVLRVISPVLPNMITMN